MRATQFLNHQLLPAVTLKTFYLTQFRFDPVCACINLRLCNTIQLCIFFLVWTEEDRRTMEIYVFQNKNVEPIINWNDRLSTLISYQICRKFFSKLHLTLIIITKNNVGLRDLTKTTLKRHWSLPARKNETIWGASL